MSVITKEIGRVSIVPKGVWNGQNTYTRLDLVSYNGNSYIAKQDVPENTNLNNNNYWKLVAEKGDIGTSISDIRKTGTNVLTDTYTIDFTDGTNTTFDVENGNGVLNITKTGTSGIVNTYTITFEDGTSTTFNVTNGNGITSVTKTGTSANRLTDTYTITFEDGTSTTFNVNHGVGILSVTGPVSNGLTDTYTINFTDGTNTTFDVQNAKSIVSITEIDVTHEANHEDKYRINYNDETHFDFKIKNGRNGDGAVSTIDGIQASEQDVNLLILGNSVPTTSTVGKLKQRYYDRTNEILYICTGIDTSGAQAVYTWQGTCVPVDNQLDENSENPVQNKVLTAKIGTDNLITSAQNLIGAVNATYLLTQDKLHEGNVASQHNTSETYNTGDYVIYARDLYRCIDDNVTGIWNASKWQKITITDEIATKAPIGLGIINASVGKVPVIKTVDANGVPTSYEFGDKGTSIDSELLTTSENPVQNKIITEKVGTTTLNTIAQDLSGAVNELLTADQSKVYKVNIANLITNTQHLVGEYGYSGAWLYRCIEEYTGGFQASKWELMTVMDEVDGKYVKPSTGIPKTDLASDVQSSLEKADTALQNGALPAGGVAGQIPVKASATDYDTTWQYPQYSRPNLLDNWYFAGGGSQLGDGVFPINQRGQANYQGNAHYFDRWISTNSRATVAINSDCIRMSSNSDGSSYLRQYHIDIPIGTYTVSALVRGTGSGAVGLTVGGALTGSISFTVSDNAKWTCVSKSVTLNTLPDTFSIRADADANINVLAVKLEVGTYQTLAHNEGTEEKPNWVLNELPNYGQELAKCRRKYVKITKIPLSGFLNSSGKFCYVDTGFEMDGTVALTVSSLGMLMTTAGNKTLSGVTVQASMSPHICLRFDLETVDSTVGYRPACIADPVIELSTE